MVERGKGGPPHTDPLGAVGKMECLILALVLISILNKPCRVTLKDETFDQYGTEGMSLPTHLP